MLFPGADYTLPGVPNYIKYYRECENPWENRFKGTDKDWHMELGTPQFMKHHFCVIKLWKYCIDAADKVMRGTHNETNAENGWFVDHDAL